MLKPMEIPSLEELKARGEAAMRELRMAINERAGVAEDNRRVTAHSRVGTVRWDYPKRTRLR